MTQNYILKLGVKKLIPALYQPDSSTHTRTHARTHTQEASKLHSSCSTQSSASRS